MSQRQFVNDTHRANASFIDAVKASFDSPDSSLPIAAREELRELFKNRNPSYDLADEVTRSSWDDADFARSILVILDSHGIAVQVTEYAERWRKVTGQKVDADPVSIPATQTFTAVAYTNTLRGGITPARFYLCDEEASLRFVKEQLGSVIGVRGALKFRGSTYRYREISSGLNGSCVSLTGEGIDGWVTVHTTVPSEGTEHTAESIKKIAAEIAEEEAHGAEPMDHT